MREDAQALAVRVDPVDQARPGGEEDLVGGGHRVAVHGQEAGAREGRCDDDEVFRQLGEWGVATDDACGTDIGQPQEEGPAGRALFRVELLVDGFGRGAQGTFHAPGCVVVVHGDASAAAAFPAHEQDVGEQGEQGAFGGSVARVGGGHRVEEQIHQGRFDGVTECAGGLHDDLGELFPARGADHYGIVERLAKNGLGQGGVEEVGAQGHHGGASLGGPVGQ